MTRLFIFSSMKVVAVYLALLLPAGTSQASEFFAGKNITLYVGFEAGGGYDLYARLVGRHLGRFIPGEPKIIVLNMPGAAGLRVANYVYQVAPQDGTALAIAAESIALEQALQGAGTEYDASKLSWIGRIAPSASITFTWHTSKVKNFDDVRKQEAVIGATGVTGITSYTPRALNRLAGSKFKLVTGYSGSSGVLLAMERGEVEGGFAIWPEFMKQKADWLAQKKLNILYIVAGKRAPELSDVPITGELGRDDEAKAVLRFLASTTEIGRSVFSAPNVPTERLTQLRRAFASMMRDREFQRDAQQMGLQIDPLAGEQLQKDVTAVIHSPKTIIEKAKAARD